MFINIGVSRGVAVELIDATDFKYEKYTHNSWLYLVTVIKVILRLKTEFQTCVVGRYELRKSSECSNNNGKKQLFFVTL